MPTLTDRADRHVVIDRREGEYLCFPDVVFSDERLIVAYNAAEQHVTPSRRDLLVRASRDLGQTWGDIVRVDVRRSHCPRLNKLPDGSLHMTSSNVFQHFSKDNGQTWDTRKMTGFAHDMLDRVIVLDDGSWLTTGHLHRGTEPHPAIRQAPTEQMVYRSDDQGEHWLTVSVIARERNLVLCEASLVRLPDGRLLALLRENSFIYEPMYACLSEDEGATWSDPIPTPLIGHRPTVGLTSQGLLLVTYRNVAPDMGTCAWLGTPEELLGGFRVQGRHEAPADLALTDEGLRIHNKEDTAPPVRYVLRPLTDPRSATATLEAEVRVDMAGDNGCGLRLGTWWRIFPDRIVPDTEDGGAIPLAPGRFHTLRLDYAHGQVALSVDGEERLAIEVEEDCAETRAILFGAPYPFKDNDVDATWRRVSLSTREPRLQRSYAWSWHAGQGMPDQWALDNILELKNDRHAAAPDFGYSGWAELPDGSFFCAYHHGDGTDPEYSPLFTSHIMGTRFRPADFEPSLGS
ncbi:exo-alpha-sialidase [Pseudodesulfovibrio cashew]|uniref:Exo-alpha-sialidase n=1 Tax=Pseudodesulfovibrio cashew TaxID=2678688 RepID=A0A6I6JCH0_9BACT|nr:exo-alpha-sialidase [Pseudodesulfovibrio cashew]QGY40505.1 exo-alpha-sialidase [Pseudodesulfovibrio cashew]